MSKITPFLWFDNQAEEAAKFYTSIFESSKLGRITRYTEVGPGPRGSVMTAEFEIGGQAFTALNGGPHFKFNESISFVVHCASQEEVDRYWERLLAGGGSPQQCGWLTDRYGLSWQIVPDVLLELIADRDTAKGNRVMQAMMQMVKLDIRRLEQAARGE